MHAYIYGSASVNEILLCVKSLESTYLPHFFTCVIVILSNNCLQVHIFGKCFYFILITELPHLTRSKISLTEAFPMHNMWCNVARTGAYMP